MSATEAPPFRCPICRSRYFTDVRVKRADGRVYRTEFLECCGCSVMFRDAARFTRFEPYAPPVPLPSGRKPTAVTASASEPVENGKRPATVRELRRESRLKR